jgi:DNA polymerase I-like protein with 3'-5' exonuclease and polymerase domains
MILDVDLSQIEWRVVAALTGDKAMMDEIRNKVDQHAAACVDLMEFPLNKENRTLAKIFNFRAKIDWPLAR